MVYVMKKEFIIENLYSNDKVCVYEYDKKDSVIIDYCVEILNKEKALKKYFVIGEIINGLITVYNDNDDDYYDYFVEEEDDA